MTPSDLNIIERALSGQEITSEEAERAMEAAEAAARIVNVPRVTDMSLRDMFAGSALQGMLAAAHAGSSAQECAEAAYAIADAMLAERAKPIDHQFAEVEGG